MRTLCTRAARAGILLACPDGGCASVAQGDTRRRRTDLSVRSCLRQSACPNRALNQPPQARRAFCGPTCHSVTVLSPIWQNRLMATLRELFFTEFTTGSDPFRLSVTILPLPRSLARVHFDSTSNVRYVSYFVPGGIYTSELIAYLSRNPSPILSSVANSVTMTIGHPAVYGPPSDGNVPFLRAESSFMSMISSPRRKGRFDKGAARAGIFFCKSKIVNIQTSNRTRKACCLYKP